MLNMSERERLRKQVLRAYPEAIKFIEEDGISPLDVANMKVKPWNIRNGGRRLTRNIRRLLTKYSKVCEYKK